MMTILYWLGAMWLVGVPVIMIGGGILAVANGNPFGLAGIGFGLWLIRQAIIPSER